MIVGVRWAGLRISQVADLRGFTFPFNANDSSSILYRAVQKAFNESSSVCKNTLLMREVKGEWLDRFMLTGKVW